jgi:hypothetical protein
MIEAKLHYLEMVDATERQEVRIRQHLLSGGDPLKFPPPVSPADELPPLAWELHEAGFFRAIASTLDCLAAVALGIGAFPRDLFRTDWGRLNDELNKTVSTPPSGKGQVLQAKLAQDILDAVAALPPEGWIPWASETRNMLVHRARLMGLEQGHVPGRGRISLPGAPARWLRIAHHLPRRPDLSLIEGMRDSPQIDDFCFAEDGRETTERLLASCHQLAESVGALVLSFWQERKSDPSLITQPVAKQWPPRRQTALTFGGFAPGTLPFDVDTMMLDPALGQRLVAGGVSDRDRRAVWGTRSGRGG